MAMDGCSVSYLFKRLILHRPDKDEDEQPESQLKKLEGDLKTGRISGDEYFEERRKLTQTINVYKEELHRLGVVT